jgi:hypothetical protein
LKAYQKLMILGKDKKALVIETAVPKCILATFVTRSSLVFVRRAPKGNVFHGACAQRADRGHAGNSFSWLQKSRAKLHPLTCDPRYSAICLLPSKTTAFGRRHSFH